MRRADRLFQIVQIVRGRRLTTARYLAERLKISERTVYRDIADLSSSGVPILGEAGVGYVLQKGFDLPPLMFTGEEVEALLIGARMVGSWGGTALAMSAAQAMEKIAAILPAGSRAAMETTQVHAPDFHIDQTVAARFEKLRQAVKSKHYVDISYEAPDSPKTNRRLRPVALHFWGGSGSGGWTLAAWCELRHDFRLFRIDRITELAITPEMFREEAGKTIADFMRHIKQKSSVPDGAMR